MHQPVILVLALFKLLPSDTRRGLSLVSGQFCSDQNAGLRLALLRGYHGVTTVILQYKYSISTV